MNQTSEFFAKHGSATIIFARFIPIILPFVPFVAGVGKMSYSKFISFNAIGGILWVIIALFDGYFFSNIHVFKDNFRIMIIGILVVSLFPVACAFIKNKVVAKKL
ncbi:VTT domain-containing protein [Heyndrickxia sp. FSL W8-0496]|uniref:VTT domain-containing protein n=1 Tax=Heyndrickxia TaxID=2837504 RepID=UPI0030FC79D9